MHGIAPTQLPSSTRCPIAVAAYGGSECDDRRRRALQDQGNRQRSTPPFARSRLRNVTVITVDDPVEYQLPGSNQVAANEAIGMTFAAALRSLLRQANIILVGKISDRETAEIAVQKLNLEILNTHYIAEKQVLSFEFLKYAFAVKTEFGNFKYS